MMRRGMVAPFLLRLCVRCVGGKSIRGREAHTSLSRDTHFDLQPTSFTIIHCLRELCGRPLALLLMVTVLHRDWILDFKTLCCRLNGTRQGRTRICPMCSQKFPRAPFTLPRWQVTHNYLFKVSFLSI
jgi:hypothetical protein